MSKLYFSIQEMQKLAPQKKTFVICKLNKGKSLMRSWMPLAFYAKVNEWKKFKLKNTIHMTFFWVGISTLVNEKKGIATSPMDFWGKTIWMYNMLRKKVEIAIFKL